MGYDTGEICHQPGTYRFLHFIDEHGNRRDLNCKPTDEERIIKMEAEKGFPPINTCKSGARWEFVSA